MSVSRHVLLGLLIMCAACSESAVEPTPKLAVSVSTSGDDPDTDGYYLLVDGDSVGSVAAQGTATLPFTPTNSVAVIELRGLAPNCTAWPASISAATHNVSSVEVSFAVSCIRKTGTLLIQTATLGSDLDPGYSVEILGTTRSLGSNAQLTLPGTRLGTYVVVLGGIAENCTARGALVRIAEVAYATTTTVLFEIDCEPNVGVLSIYASKTGAGSDEDGFLRYLDEGAPEFYYRSGTSELFPTAPVGNHTVRLAGLSSNCVVDRAVQSVTVRFHATSEVHFNVTCSATTGPFRTIAFQLSWPYRAIWSARSDGSERRQLSTSGDSDPAWSPDGTRLVFTCPTPPRTDLCTVNADGTNYHHLTNTPDMSEGSPSFSPDGLRIVHHAVLASGESVIRVVDADGNNAVSLTSGNDDRRPSYSPDGARIVFDRAGTARDIWTMAADGTDLVRLTFAQTNQNATYSPDGQRIMYAYGVPNVLSIREMNADGTNQTALPWIGMSRHARYSPDGTMVVFEEQSDGGINISEVTRDGQNRRRVTSNRYENLSPVYQP